MPDHNSYFVAEKAMHTFKGTDKHIFLVLEAILIYIYSPGNVVGLKLDIVTRIFFCHEEAVKKMR